MAQPLKDGHLLAIVDDTWCGTWDSRGQALDVRIFSIGAEGWLEKGLCDDFVAVEQIAMDCSRQIGFRVTS